MNERLKIGFLINSTNLPLWQIRLIERLKGSDYASLDLIILNDSDSKSMSLFNKIKDNWSNIFFVLFQKIEMKLFKVDPNAHEIRSSNDILRNIPMIKVNPISTKYSDRFSPEKIKSIKKYNLDILIRFGFKILRGEILKSSKYGVWSYHHGDNNENRGGPAGYWEVFEGHDITGSILQILNEDLDNGQILYRSFSATDKKSITRNRNNFYWKSMSFLPRKIEQLHKLGEDRFFEIVKKENSTLKIYSNKLNSRVLFTNWFMTKYVFNYILKEIKSRVLDKIYFNQWYLLYSLGNGLSTSIWRFKKIIPPKDRFYADPFIIEFDNYYYIFIEELMYNTEKGHISVIKMDDQGNYDRPVKVIDQKYHLSYPFIFQKEKQYYLIPDSKSNNTIELYKCKKFPYEWEFHMTLMKDVKAVDTTIYFYKNKYWLFTNIVENEGASTWDELFLFYSDNLETTNWEPHLMNPIVSDVRRARSAGNIFLHNGKLIRPSQDCSKRYGYGIRLNEIKVLNEYEYVEDEIDFIDPGWESKVEAVHTINFKKNLTVIDANMKRLRLF